MEQVYVPPPGLRFRLQDRDSGRILVANENDSLSSYEGDSHYPNQWFTLEHAGHADEYLIRSVYDRTADKFIFSRPDAEVGLYYSNHTDQHFKIEVGTDDFSGYFRLVSAHSDLAMRSRGAKLSNHHLDGSKPHDQYFRFLFEDIHFDRIEYDLDRGEVSTAAPIFVPGVVTNRSKSACSMTACLSQTITESISLNKTSGMSLKQAATARFGVPNVVEGEISAQLGIGQELSFGKTNTVEHAVGAHVDIQVPPRSTQKVVGMVKQGTVKVPARIFWKSKSLGIEAVTDVVYEGSPYLGFDFKIEEPVHLHKNEL